MSASSPIERLEITYPFGFSVLYITNSSSPLNLPLYQYEFFTILLADSFPTFPSTVQLDLLVGLTNPYVTYYQTANGITYPYAINYTTIFARCQPFAINRSPKNIIPSRLASFPSGFIASSGYYASVSERIELERAERVSALSFTQRQDVTRVQPYINNNYSKAISLEDICKEIHISKYHFCRKFKQVMGITVMEYILKTRVAAAKIFLQMII